MSEFIVLLLVVLIYFIPILLKGRISAPAQITFHVFLLLFWIAITIIDPVNVYFSIAIGMIMAGTLLRKMVQEGMLHHRIWRTLAYGVKSDSGSADKML